MNNEKEHTFDFYYTPMYFDNKNDDEKYLKLSDYGITKNDIYIYYSQMERQREEAKERYIIYEHRCVFFKVVSVLLLVGLFYFIIGHFNDFMKRNDLFFDILLYPFYIGLIVVLYKCVYQKMVCFIENVRDKIEEQKKYPNGHPDGYDPRVEKYFNDLLQILQEQPSR